MDAILVGVAGGLVITAFYVGRQWDEDDWYVTFFAGVAGTISGAIILHAAQLLIGG